MQKEIQNKVKELNEIVHQHPDTIPVPVLAKFFLGGCRRGGTVAVLRK